MSRPSAADALAELEVGGRRLGFFSLAQMERRGLGPVSRLPRSLKILLENLLRHHHLGKAVESGDVAALANWTADRKGGRDIAYHPARIIMPDSSGIPLLADLAAMRDAMVDLGGDPRSINPLSHVDIVVDHSAIVDVFGSADAAARNLAIEYERNGERYAFLRWAQSAFANLRIVPSGQGIIHQVNIEYLAKVVLVDETALPGTPLAFPDTVLGMDSHTPMVNALGVVGWGCGGIEAGAAMLGQPVSMAIPEVIGVRFVGKLAPGVTATDLVLTVTERLRKHGVVQKFVEYLGPGLTHLTMATRATIANMAPEYGATIGFFPIDAETLAYLAGTGRSQEQIDLVEAYAKAQGLWFDAQAAEPDFTDLIEIDLSQVVTSLAGPKRPQDRVALPQVKAALDAVLDAAGTPRKQSRVTIGGTEHVLADGHLAIAAITSCTNTSNPNVIIGAALLARNAAARGLTTKPWVKTSFSPGSRVVAEYLRRAGLQSDLDRLGFQVVGFGCMTCMGNSGPLDDGVARAVDEDGLALAAVLSGNRNFEGRVHTRCRINYLASPPLVIAYALAGRMTLDLTREPIGTDRAGKPVYLADIWPSDEDIAAIIQKVVTPDLYRERYADVFAGDEHWRRLAVRGGDTFAWKDESRYIRRPPFFGGIQREAVPPGDISGARILAMFGDSITTDHISPIGVIANDSPAGAYLSSQGIAPKDFNSYASRRVNHDVMVRGTFANIRIRNEMAGGREGGHTLHMPDAAPMSIYDAAMAYRREKVPLVIVAGCDYGAGSSRDWAAKGTLLLGVRAVLAESFERIHRSNLIGMGILPCEFQAGQSRKTLGLDGSETIDLIGIKALKPRAPLVCVIHRADGSRRQVTLTARIDTAYELQYFRNGGILQLMLRQMLKAA
ncbi:aconitate hydratase AcnA [Bosea sp. (in: a-proteobacteria)]|uniref:aconitate hydratase AcnA n=1 Tax=Bosea sp. (in: a-proteobacteria) TaxID=1871050 RepID=UPI00260AA8AE|nr:aconitate hydratase AcnA [Bosea sp. (in: a-proteobacteria)]MCO5090589.1 aconitate hydratase AcnA [Bosea sp. (in: a-proteobacteria)]